MDSLSGVTMLHKAKWLRIGDLFYSLRPNRSGLHLVARVDGPFKYSLVGAIEAIPNVAGPQAQEKSA